MSSPKIIAFSGKIGSGKDFLTDVIKEFLKDKKYLHLAFADQLKVDLMVEHGIPYNDFYVQKTAQARVLLQETGTRRRERNESLWSDYLRSWVKVYFGKGVEYFLISDLRYKTEYEALKKENACIFRISAPQRTRDKIMRESNGNEEIYKKISEHSSETNLDNESFEFTIQNDYEDDFSQTKQFIISKILEKFKD